MWAGILAKNDVPALDIPLRKDCIGKDPDLGRRETVHRDSGQADSSRNYRKLPPKRDIVDAR
jgi:hypothetical protein